MLEQFEEAAEAGIQSLALDNSFLVSGSGIQVVKNFSHRVHVKGVSDAHSSYSTPKKALLIKAETNMLLMSPASTGKPYATGLHQLDIETGKVVTEWRFKKDGTDITMRDITNDNKGADGPIGVDIPGLGQQPPLSMGYEGPERDGPEHGERDGVAHPELDTGASVLQGGPISSALPRQATGRLPWGR